MSPSIIFDFDGTLAIGHGPVLAYARCVLPHARENFLEHVEKELTLLDAGDQKYRDGYDVVGTLAHRDGVSPQTMQAAYVASRELLGTQHAPVDTMPSLEKFLAELKHHARLVLATNAPEQGVGKVLESWGVHDVFDELNFTVGKPAGLHPIIHRALEMGPVLAIGDIVEFDLMPAIDLGAETALVGPLAATSNAPLTMRGATLAELTPAILAWAATAATQ